MAIKDNLKNARMAKGLTLDEVASKVGVSRQTIQRYESGVISNIPSGNIEKLASALDTTPAELMGWNDGAVKVTTNITFDNNSPMHALTQAYIRRPALVQDEIIKRLEGLDVTFSKKVSKLLQASGDINGFMQGTGLPFATVGKFMQGETVLTTPTEAERIATYFHANVVDLFFDDASAQQKPLEDPKPAPSSKKDETTNSSYIDIDPDFNIAEYLDYSQYAYTFIKLADLEWPNDVLGIRHREFLDVLKIEGFDTAMDNLPDELCIEDAAKIILDNARDFYAFTSKHSTPKDIVDFIKNRASRQ